jgi:hypothetical protein
MGISLLYPEESVCKGYTMLHFRIKQHTTYMYVQPWKSFSSAIERSACYPHITSCICTEYAVQVQYCIASQLSHQ